MTNRVFTDLDKARVAASRLIKNNGYGALHIVESDGLYRVSFSSGLLPKGYRFKEEVAS